jgi:hypothetical protein
MADFITNGATELPAVGDDGKVRSANNWTVGDTYDIQQALLDLRTGTLARVTSVTGTAPVESSGGTAPAISIPSSLYEGWDDVFGDISQGTSSSSLTYEALRDTAFKAYHFQNNQLDSLMMRFQMPHSWDHTEVVVPHLHVMPLVNPASEQNVRLTGYYCWTDLNNAMPALTGWTTFGVSLPITTTSAYKTVYANLASITPPENSLGSSILLVYVSRNGGVGDDTYTTNKVGGTVQANLALMSLDVHYKKVRIGSPTLTPI